MDEVMSCIRSIHTGKERTLTIIWKGGAESTADISQHLAEYAVFEPLRDDDSLFCSVSLGEWGWCAHWTDDLEISSDTLMRLSLEQGAAWLSGWRGSRGLTQAEAAAALGVSPRMWRYYEAATHLLPKTLRLACIGFDAQSRAA